MQFSRVGRSGLTVSRLAMGTMNFGTHVDERTAFGLLDRAVDAGITVLDTADVYGWGENVGASERIIGRYLTGRPGLRDDLVIATKLYRRMGPGTNMSGLSARRIRRACEESLRRLDVDHLDLYQFHHYDTGTPLDEVWEACETLLRQGKVVYFGSSNFAGWQLAEAQWTARRTGLTGLVSEQSVFNLLTRHAELEVLPACAHLGLGMLAWSPLCDGLLAGPPGDAGRRAEPGNLAAYGRHSGTLERFYRYCAELGRSPAQVALAWVLDQPGVTSAIIGPRTAVQLEDSIGCLDVELDDSVRDELNELFPGFQPAPQHYAW